MQQPDDNMARDANTAATTLVASATELGLLHAVLNQVDYGLAVVDASTRQLLFANGPAHAALHATSPQNTGLCLHEGRLCARLRAHEEPLQLALTRTRTGVRGLLNLTEGSNEATVAVMPLLASATPSYALVVFAKQQLCDTTTITLFARERGLTGAEGQVLAQVCKGLRPQEIATRHGVQVSTVRTQLRSIRQKTASDSVRELVEQVSVLPPLAWRMPSVPALLGSFNRAGMAFG